MFGDLYRDMTHSEMQQLIWRKVAKFADYAKVEHKLLNGKIADVFYLIGAARVIVEVKTLFRDSLVYSAYEKYGDQCDYLILAAPAPEIRQAPGQPLSVHHVGPADRVGLWRVEWTGITEVRAARLLHTKTPRPELF